MHGSSFDMVTVNAIRIKAESGGCDVMRHDHYLAMILRYRNTIPFASLT